jgi:hypothetical protein
MWKKLLALILAFGLFAAGGCVTVEDEGEGENGDVEEVEVED